MVHTSRIAHIFHAQETFGISALSGCLGGSDRAWIFLRLGEINGDIQIAIFCLRHPFDVLTDTVPPDIIGILAQLIEIVCGLLWRFLLINCPELLHDLTGSRHQAVH